MTIIVVNLQDNPAVFRTFTVFIWLSFVYIVYQKQVTLTAAPNSVDVSIAPSLVFFLATECKEILDIFPEMVVFPAPRYFDTENKEHVGNHIYLQFQS
jgi:hypothetical protein